MIENIFLITGLLILTATLFALIARITKQPLIPAYIIAGLILGPIFHIIPHSEAITSFSDIGVAFLLFLVGLELDYNKLKKIGSTILIGGTIQNIVLMLLGYVVALLFGLSKTTAVYFAAFSSFSSTMIVIKMLSDKAEIDTLHGKMVIGFLLLEDLFALFILSSLTILSSFNFLYLILIILKIIALLSISFLINRFIILPLFRYTSKSQEVHFLMALSSAFFFSFLYLYFGKVLLFFLNYIMHISEPIREILGQEISIAIGAFVAGIGLASSKYSYSIIGKINPLRDFFSTLFFVSLGIGLEFSGINFPIIIALVIIIIVVRPIISYLNLHLFGYTSNTSFHTAIYLTQLSEFSLILLSLGISYGHLSREVYSSIVIVALITIATSSYIVKFSNQVYSFFSPILSLIDIIKINKKNVEFLPGEINKEVLLIGFDRVGYSIFKTLKKLRKDFLVVDFNPDVIEKLIKRKVHCIYGDIVNPEIFERVHPERAKMIISTVPDIETNKIILTKSREINKKATIIVTAYDVEESLELYELGADYVIIPHLLGGSHMSLLIEQFHDNLKQLSMHRRKHLRELKEHLKAKRV